MADGAFFSLLFLDRAQTALPLVASLPSCFLYRHREHHLIQLY
jgi:hypothetical protein